MNLLFVCTGNTCRSPMAEAIAKVLMDKLDIQGEAASAGVHAYEGMPASVGAQMAIAMAGGDLEHHHATQLTAAHAAQADLILCMEQRHVDAVLATAPGARGKVHTLLGYAGLEGDVSDPFGGDEDTYVTCLTQIGNAVRIILEKSEK